MNSYNKKNISKTKLVLLMSITIIFITILIAFPFYSLITLGLVVGLIIFLKNPPIIVYLMILLIPFNIDLGYGLTPSRGLTIVSILILGLEVLFGNKKIKKTPLDFPLMVFLIVVLFSFFNSVDIAQSSRNYITLISLVIRYYAVIILIQNEDHLKKALKYYFVSILLASIFGIFQYLDYEMGLKLGLVNTVDLVGGHLRVSNYFLDSNFYANYLIGTFPFLIGFIINDPKKKNKFILLIVFMFALVNLFLTFSRSALLSLVFGLILIIFYLKKHLRVGRFFVLGLITSSIILAIVLTTSIFNSYILRIQGGFNDLSILNRFAVLVAGINIIKDNFWFGIGYENALYHVVKYADPMYPIYEGAIDVHNVHLKVFVETGFFGFISYIWIIRNYLKNLKIMYLRSSSWFSKAFVQGCIGGILMMLVNGFMLSSLLAIENWVVYFGLGMAYLNLRKRSNSIA